jgi:hypothetical protein
LVLHEPGRDRKPFAGQRLELQIGRGVGCHGRTIYSGVLSGSGQATRTLGMTSTQVFRVVLVAHLLAGIGAFGPLLVMPLIVRRANAGGFGSAGHAVAASTSRWVRRRVSEPCFVAVGVLGLVAAWAHPDNDLFGYLWVRLAVVFWLVAVVVVLFVQGPLARRAERLARALWTGEGAADDGARLARVTRQLELLTMVSAVGLPVMVWLMVFQPH